MIRSRTGALKSLRAQVKKLKQESKERATWLEEIARLVGFNPGPTFQGEDLVEFVGKDIERQIIEKIERDLAALGGPRR